MRWDWALAPAKLVVLFTLLYSFYCETGGGMTRHVCRVDSFS
jgi:hypothetical protein